MRVVPILVGVVLAAGPIAPAVLADDGLSRCTSYGTPGDDYREVLERHEVYCGLGGDDTVVRIFFGESVFFGGPGNDRVSINYGRFYGGPGDDEVTDFTQWGTFDGGPGDDRVGANDGTFLGGPGDDVLGANSDRFFGGPGDDLVGRNEWSTVEGPGLFFGGPGDDHVDENPEGALFDGGPGYDTVTNNEGTFDPGPQRPLP